MPSLLIHIVEGNWVAEIANTEVAYTFTGAGLNVQAGWVQQLAQSMTYGAGDVIDRIRQVFSDLPAGSDAQIVADLFNPCQVLVYDEAPIYTCAEGASLLTDMAEAGEALVWAL